jgi:pyridinium-3,5-biscarboxylic acid mononucleotide sulfurtransferase
MEMSEQEAPDVAAVAGARAFLRGVIGKMEGAAVAVSGGVDSLTLATIAHEVLGKLAVMHHATSPAVPAEAADRVRSLANERKWTLDVFAAGEFADPAYRDNPVNRCFFCKTNLYGAIASRTASLILSGTNLDDLDDYRPGLDAARNHRLRHPFVEAGVDRQWCGGLRRTSVSAISRSFLLHPACLAG